MYYILQHIFIGFLVKSIASFDDTLTRIPILAELTKTFKGKVAFSIGTLLALTVILIIAIFFSSLFELIPFRQQVLAALIALLGLAVYFELFIPKEDNKLHRMFFSQNARSHSHFINLLAIGFVISFITFLDDALVLLPLFISDNTQTFLATIGIYIAALTQIVLVIFLSKQLEKIKYKKEMATGALLILAFFVWFGFV